MERKNYQKPNCRYLIVDEESLMDTISGGTGGGTNTGGNAKEMIDADQPAVATPKSVWDD